MNLFQLEREKQLGDGSRLTAEYNVKIRGV